IVNNQAFRLLPDWNCSRLVHALSTVSCTRSSARAGSPHSERPKARNAGSNAVTCSRNLSCPVIEPARDSRKDEETAPLGAALLVLELLQQRLELVRHRFVHDVAEHAAQPALEPIRHRLGAARSRRFRRLAWFDFFAHDHGYARAGASRARCVEIACPARTFRQLKEFQVRRNLSPLSLILQRSLPARAMQRP